MKANKLVWLADETSCNLWSKSKLQNTWAKVSFFEKVRLTLTLTFTYFWKRGEPITRTRNSKRLSSVTVYGAVNAVTGAFVWMLHERTNQEGWKMFLRKLKEHTDERYIEPPIYLCIDNHPVHRARGVRRDYEGFKVLFSPPYSSELNAVESVWAQFKAKLSKHVDRIPQELT